MKTRKLPRSSAIFRISLAGMLFVFGGANPFIALGSSYMDDDAKGGSSKDECSAWDETDNRETPLLELDPERKYKSEALLSYKSSLAPYGKIVGIRVASSTTFTSVATWQDVEDFVKGISEDKVVVKLLEPWGAELVSNVSVNRKVYPASTVRPADPPQISKPSEGPKPVSKTSIPKTAPKVVLITADTPKTSLATSHPTFAPETSNPSKVRSLQASAIALKTGPRLIEPNAATRIAIAKADLKTVPSAKMDSTKPAIAKNLGSPKAAIDTAPRLTEPRQIAAKAALAASQANTSPSTGQARFAKNSTQGRGQISASPKLIEPSGVVLRSSADWFDPYQIVMLSSAPFMPRMSAPEIHEIPRAAAIVAVAPVISTGRPLARLAKGSTVAADTRDEGAWLQEAIDSADRLGILACKPVITSDRRQRAFALYTLYMGLKDLRVEIDHKAGELNQALGKLSAGHEPSDSDMRKIVGLGRSYEIAMNAISSWDAEATKGVIKVYSSELQAMDEVRSMLSFLSKMKKEPDIVRDLRTISGLEQTEN